MPMTILRRLPSRLVLAARRARAAWLVFGGGAVLLSAVAMSALWPMASAALPFGLGGSPSGRGIASAQAAEMFCAETYMRYRMQPAGEGAQAAYECLSESLKRDMDVAGFKQRVLEMAGGRAGRADRVATVKRPEGGQIVVYRVVDNTRTEVYSVYLTAEGRIERTRE